MQDDEAARGGRYAGGYMVDAAYAQLIGICRGVLADNRLNNDEIRAIDAWLTQHDGQLPVWPTRALAQRVKQVIADGEITDDERLDLMAFLVQLSPKPEQVTGGEAPTALPFTNPEPDVVYSDHGFCLTGTFLFGPRRHVEDAIEDRGGTIATVAKADYLIIGATVTPAWKYGTHGLKIEGAMTRRIRSRPLVIVSEEHWRRSP